MHRRNFLYTAGLTTGAALLFQKSALAAVLRPVDFKIRMLRGNAGIFTERGGTIGFLLSEDGAVVIDSQFEDTAPHLIDALKKQRPVPVRFLLNTHHHRDHTGGNVAFKGIAEHVVAHQNAVANQKAVAEKAATADKQLYADQTFDKELKLTLEKTKITGTYFGAGHTNGDAVYHLEEANVMHVGDLVFNKRHPYVDRSAGANMRNWISVLEQIQKKGTRDTLYIFGHSLKEGEETGTAEDLKKFADYLDKVLRFAEAERKKGVSKEEFIKNTAIPGVTEWSGQGIERPLTAAYEELSSQ